MKAFTFTSFDKKIPVKLTEESSVFEVSPPNPQGVPDEEGEARRALSDPIGSEKLSEIVKPGMKVAVICDDYTRPTPIWRLVPVLLEEIEGAGVDAQNIVLVVAHGFHEPDVEKARAKLGERVFGKYKVVLHDALVKDDMRFCGVTSQATPVWVNRAVADADVKVGLGHVNAHTRAGYSGGAKIILPGVSSVETIDHNHLLYIAPGSKIFALDGNPLREDAEEAARLAGLDLILNVVLNRERRVVHAVSGDPFKAFRAGVQLWEKAYEVKVPRRADVVVVSSEGGSPYLVNALYPTILAEHLTRPGGTIIMRGSCIQGWAPETGGYDRTLAPRSMMQLRLEDIYRVLMEHRFTCSRQVVQAFEFRKVIEERQVILVSGGFPREEALSYGLNPALSFDEAVENALQTQGRDAFFINLTGPGMFFPSSEDMTP